MMQDKASSRLLVVESQNLAAVEISYQQKQKWEPKREVEMASHLQPARSQLQSILDQPTYFQQTNSTILHFLHQKSYDDKKQGNF